MRMTLGGSANMMEPFLEKPKVCTGEATSGCGGEHHESEMEQFSKMRQWLDKLEKKVS